MQKITLDIREALVDIEVGVGVSHDDILNYIHQAILEVEGVSEYNDKYIKVVNVDIQKVYWEKKS